MRTYKYVWFFFTLALAIWLPACRTIQPPEAGSTAKVPSELLETNYLFEVVRYLYRWELDEAEVERSIGAGKFEFWVKRLHRKLDPGDRSILGEILLPGAGLRVKVKKADYAIEDLGTSVKSQNFMITQVTREKMPARVPPASQVVTVDMKEMRDYLFRTRNQLDYPDPALLERLRQALRKETLKAGLLTNAPVGEQIIHLASLSPVANEYWVFWESGRKLLHFSSDIDLANPAVWQHEALMVRVFDLDQQVVVSHEENPGSNRFVTRYEASRALFNCIVLGQRISLPP